MPRWRIHFVDSSCNSFSSLSSNEQGRSHYDRFTGVDTQRSKFSMLALWSNGRSRHGSLQTRFLPAFQDSSTRICLEKAKNFPASFRNSSSLAQIPLPRPLPTHKPERTITRITDLAGSSNASSMFLPPGLPESSSWFRQFLHEQVTVFRVHDSLYRCTKYFPPYLSRIPLCVEFRTAVQCSLSAECQQDTVRTFFLDNFFYKISSYGKEIHFIGNSFRSLNGCDVRVLPILSWYLLLSKLSMLVNLSSQILQLVRFWVLQNPKRELSWFPFPFLLLL